jgi:hypothetical protein
VGQLRPPLGELVDLAPRDPVAIVLRNLRHSYSSVCLFVPAPQRVGAESIAWTKARLRFP